MKNTINLFSTDLLPTYPWYHAKYFFRLALASILLAGLSFALIQAYLYQLHQEELNNQYKIDQITQKNNQIRQDIEAFLQEHEGRDFLTLQRKIKHYQSILEQVKKTQTHNDLRLHPILYSLATIKTSDLWLTSIEVSLPDITFKGITLNPKSLPNWVEAVKRHDAFRSYRFSHVEMEATTDQHKQVQFLVILSRFKP